MVNYKFINLILFSACLLIIISFFLPWAKVIFISCSAYDFSICTFSGENIHIIQRAMFLFIILPLISIFGIIFETITYRNKHINIWMLHFINSIILIIMVGYYLNVSTGEIGVFVCSFATILLAATSLIKRRQNTKSGR